MQLKVFIHGKISEGDAEIAKIVIAENARPETRKQFLNAKMWFNCLKTKTKRHTRKEEAYCKLTRQLNGDLQLRSSWNRQIDASICGSWNGRRSGGDSEVFWKRRHRLFRAFFIFQRLRARCIALMRSCRQVVKPT